MYSPAEQQLRLERWQLLTTMQRHLVKSEEDMDLAFSGYGPILPPEIENSLSVRSKLSDRIKDLIQQLMDPNTAIDMGSAIFDRLDPLMEAWDKVSDSLFDFLVLNEITE